MLSWTVGLSFLLWFEMLSMQSSISPKPDIPSPKEYNPPSPPSPKELGPPPPGYGRYADFDRGPGAMPIQSNHGQPGNYNGPRRNLDEVLCFKVLTYLC